MPANSGEVVCVMIAPIPRAKSEKLRVTTEPLVDSYILSRASERLSTGTINAFIGDLGLFSIHLTAGGKSLPEAQADDIQRFILSMQQRGCAIATTNRRISSIRSFYEFLYKRGIVKSNPADEVKQAKIDKRKPVYLSIDESESLLKVPLLKSRFVERDTAIIVVFLHGGLRVSELINLSVSDIRWLEGYLVVFGKRRKERLIPITPEMEQALRNCISARRQIGDSAAVFVNQHGRRLTRAGVEYIIKTLVASMGLPKRVTPHKLRHTCATLLLGNGLDLRLIQRLLGHEGIQSTEVYTHVEDEQLRYHILAAHPLSKKAEAKKR